MDKVKEIGRLLDRDLTAVEEALFNDTVADVMGEFADTYNRNDTLWQEVRNSVSVDDDNASFNAKLQQAGFLSAESDGEVSEDARELRENVIGIRQLGNHSVRRYMLAGMTTAELAQHDLDRFAQEDLMALATASEKLKALKYTLGARGSSLILCLARVAEGAPRCRAQSAENTCLTPKHVSRISKHMFSYMCLVDFTCAQRHGLYDTEEIMEGSYWPHLMRMRRSNTSAGRRLQFILSEVRYGSRLVETMWGSIWPKPGTEFVPSEGELERVLSFMENDSSFVMDTRRGEEVQWAAAGRKNPKTTAENIRSKARKKQLPLITPSVRNYTPLQTLSVKREISRQRYNSAQIKRYTVNTLAVVMACFNKCAVGLQATTTVDWVYFKDVVCAVRDAIRRFRPNEEALSMAKKMTPDQASRAGTGEQYGDEHRKLEMDSLEECGFTAACEALRARLDDAAGLLSSLGS